MFVSPSALAGVVCFLLWSQRPTTADAASCVAASTAGGTISDSANTFVDCTMTGFTDFAFGGVADTTAPLSLLVAGSVVEPGMRLSISGMATATAHRPLNATIIDTLFYNSALRVTGILPSGSSVRIHRTNFTLYKYMLSVGQVHGSSGYRSPNMFFIGFQLRDGGRFIITESVFSSIKDGADTYNICLLVANAASDIVLNNGSRFEVSDTPFFSHSRGIDPGSYQTNSLVAQFRSVGLGNIVRFLRCPIRMIGETAAGRNRLNTDIPTGVKGVNPPELPRGRTSALLDTALSGPNADPSLLAAATGASIVVAVDSCSMYFQTSGSSMSNEFTGGPGALFMLRNTTVETVYAQYPIQLLNAYNVTYVLSGSVVNGLGAGALDTVLLKASALAWQGVRFYSVQSTFLVGASSYGMLQVFPISLASGAPANTPIEVHVWHSAVGGIASSVMLRGYTAPLRLRVCRNTYHGARLAGNPAVYASGSGVTTVPMSAVWVSCESGTISQVTPTATMAAAVIPLVSTASASLHRTATGSQKATATRLRRVTSTHSQSTSHAPSTATVTASPTHRHTATGQLLPTPTTDRTPTASPVGTHTAVESVTNPPPRTHSKPATPTVGPIRTVSAPIVTDTTTSEATTTTPDTTSSTSTAATAATTPDTVFTTSVATETSSTSTFLTTETASTTVNPSPPTTTTTTAADPTTAPSTTMTGGPTTTTTTSPTTAGPATPPAAGSTNTTTTTSQASVPVTAQAACAVGSARTGATMQVVRGEHRFEVTFAAAVLAVSPAQLAVVAIPITGLPSGLVEADRVTCRVAGPATLDCELVVADEKRLSGALMVELVLPAALVAAGCDGAVAVSLQLVPVSTDPSAVATAAVVVHTAAVIVGRLATVADPTAYDAMAAVVVLMSRCASVTDAAAARLTRYLLSPLVDLGPVAVGATHVGVGAAVFGAHAAAVVVAGARRSRQPTRKEWRAVWARWRFPSVSSAVALVLYPGVGWAAGELVRAAAGGGGPVGAPAGAAAVLSLCLLYLLAVPCLGAFALLRLDTDATYVPTGPVPTARGGSGHLRSMNDTGGEEPLTAVGPAGEGLSETEAVTEEDATGCALPTGSGAPKADGPRPWWRAVLWPSGEWGPGAGRRSFEGARGALAGRRGRMVPATMCTLFVAVCAVLGAPTRSASCQGQQAAGAAIVLAASAAVVAVRPFSTPLTTALYALGGATLGLLMVLQAIGASDGAKDAVVICNALVGAARSVHVLWWWRVRDRMRQ